MPAIFISFFFLINQVLPPTASAALTTQEVFVSPPPSPVEQPAEDIQEETVSSQNLIHTATDFLMVDDFNLIVRWVA